MNDVLVLVIIVAVIVIVAIVVYNNDSSSLPAATVGLMNLENGEFLHNKSGNVIIDTPSMPVDPTYEWTNVNGMLKQGDLCLRVFLNGNGAEMVPCTNGTVFIKSGGIKNSSVFKVGDFCLTSVAGNNGNIPGFQTCSDRNASQAWLYKKIK